MKQTVCQVLIKFLLYMNNIFITPNFETSTLKKNQGITNSSKHSHKQEHKSMNLLPL